MPRSSWKVWLFLIGVVVLVIGGAFVYLAWRQNVPGVQAEITPSPRAIGLRTPLTLALRAARGGIVWTEIRLVQGQGRAVLANHAFPDRAGERRLDLVVDGKNLGLREGAATLEVRAGDGFWRPLRADDRPVLSAPVTLDFTPPALELLASTRYLAQGGGGLVVFRARGASRVGVNVGGLFQPAYPVGPADGGVLAAIVALPWDFPTTTPIAVTAQDEAGNTATRAIAAEIKPRRFPSDTVELKTEFLARKLPELLPGRGDIPPDQLVPAFLTVNRDQRRAGEQAKREHAAKTQPRPLWEGAFVQPRNTKVFSNFAETRVYRYGGRDIDTSVHLGYDLASVKHSPVPAANAGAVVFTGPMTIYGNTVVVDHGLGLQTLYAHLSSIDVKEGEEVKKGQSLGRTGSTGLAVGDHLHYEVLIHGIPVTPVEWWDAKWIRDHIGLPLKEANVPVLESEQAGSAPPADRPPPAAAKRRAARAR